MTDIQPFETQQTSLTRTFRGPDGKEYRIQVEQVSAEPISADIIYQRPEVQLYPVPQQQQPVSTTDSDSIAAERHRRQMALAARSAQLQRRWQFITLAAWCGLGILVLALLLTKLFTPSAPMPSPLPVAAPVAAPVPPTPVAAPQPVIIVQPPAPAPQPAPTTIINPNCEAFCSQ